MIAILTFLGQVFFAPWLLVAAWVCSDVPERISLDSNEQRAASLKLSFASDKADALSDEEGHSAKALASSRVIFAGPLVLTPQQLPGEFFNPRSLQPISSARPRAPPQSV